MSPKDDLHSAMPVHMNSQKHGQLVTHHHYHNVELTLLGCSTKKDVSFLQHV